MTIGQDVRYALRVLRKAPAFSLVSVLTLALGIMGAAIVFQAYDAVALRPLPVSDPKSLAIVRRHLVTGGVEELFSTDAYRSLRAQTSAQMAAEGEYVTVLAHLPNQSSNAASLQVLVKPVSENYFDLLGVSARLGRVFAAQSVNGSDPVAVLSYSAFVRRFAADPAIIGKTVRLSGAAFTIIGVTPPDFIGTGLPPVPADFWLPMQFQALALPGTHPTSEATLRLLARLQPGGSRAKSEAELTAAAQHREMAGGKSETTSAMALQAPAYLVESNNPQFRTLAELLTASFVLVLLIACANLTNLSLARAGARRKELAVRRALGASRGRLARQLLVEGAMLGLFAGAISVLSARWICQLAWHQIQQRLISRFTDLYVFSFDFTPDSRVLLATLAVALGAGLLFSLLPALQASGVEVHEALQNHAFQFGAVRRRLRLSARDVLIALQVAFSVVLLVNAALVARGMVRGQAVKPGFDTGHVLDIEFSNAAAAGITPSNAAEFRTHAAQRLSTLPGIDAVAFATHVPLLGFERAEITAPGKAVEHSSANHISPGFFSVFGIGLTAGRDFTPAEIDAAAPVCIVSASTAQKLWPGQDPVGLSLLLGSARKPLRIVGVAADAELVNLGSKPLFVYLPLRADAAASDSFDIFVRTTTQARDSAGTVLDTLATMGANVASLADVHPMDDALWSQHLPSMIATGFAAAVGALALLLATIGIYGTVAYSVVQRTRELGIRIAIGAQARSVIVLVLGRVLALAASAIALGALVAGAVSRLLVALPFELGSRLLFGVSWHDPVAFASIAAVLAAVALLAAWLPARRASRVDPMVPLRSE